VHIGSALEGRARQAGSQLSFKAAAGAAHGRSAAACAACQLLLLASYSLLLQWMTMSST
jgi:hypothetical protein